MRRRDFLQTTLALATLSSADFAAAKRGHESKPFDYAVLKGQARALASAEYRPPQRTHISPAVLASSIMEAN